MLNTLTKLLLVLFTASSVMGRSDADGCQRECTAGACTKDPSLASRCAEMCSGTNYANNVTLCNKPAAPTVTGVVAWFNATPNQFVAGSTPGTYVPIPTGANTQANTLGGWVSATVKAVSAKKRYGTEDWHFWIFQDNATKKPYYISAKASVVGKAPTLTMQNGKPTFTVGQQVFLTPAYASNTGAAIGSPGYKLPTDATPTVLDPSWGATAGGPGAYSGTAADVAIPVAVIFAP